MKKANLLLFSLAVFLTACNQNSVTTLSLSSSVLSLKVGEMQSLEVQTTAEDVEWTSSNTDVATVFYGNVAAVGVGYATITVSANGVSDVCQVYVTGRSGETLRIEPEIVPLQKGETYQYKYASVYDLPLSWSSSDEKVATVSGDGLVTALAPGNAIISLTNGNETVKSRVTIPHKWSDYELVWSEEFEGTSLKTDVWNIEVNGNGGGNSEKQYYTDRAENLRLEDGLLVIQLRKEDYENKQYTSGRINTQGKKGFTYGKMVARMQLPSGGGTWPAFWMMGQDIAQHGWPYCGEIDIMEHIGNQPRMVSFALHTTEKNGTKGNNWSSRTYMDGVENGWHEYGIEWLQEEVNGLDKIIFTVDGTEYSSLIENAEHIDENRYWPFNKEFYFLLNLAVGGTMGGNIDDSMFDNGDVLMKVDWVRVWQRHEVE